jgi:hypothetical protein
VKSGWRHSAIRLSCATLKGGWHLPGPQTYSMKPQRARTRNTTSRPGDGC